MDNWLAPYTRDDLAAAWAAGLFEGEGCIYKSGGVWRLQLNMTDKDVVDRFHTFVRCGTINTCRMREDHHKEAWRWRCAARKDVQRVVRMLLPYLGTRRAAKAADCLRELAVALERGCRRRKDR